MGKSTSGPDMRDVLELWYDLQKQNQCSTILLLDADGSSAACSVLVQALSISEHKPLSDPEWSVATAGRWPDQVGRNFEAFLYWLLFEHDAEIARRQSQEAIGI